jgi:tRNA A37 methylthiotransferase MiaB
MARGKSRSDSIENVIRNAENLASNGVKEIVLTGVNLGDFKSTITIQMLKKIFCAHSAIRKCCRHKKISHFIY